MLIDQMVANNLGALTFHGASNADRLLKRHLARMPYRGRVDRPALLSRCGLRPVDHVSHWPHSL